MCVLFRSSSENFSRNKYLQIGQNKNMKRLLVSSSPCLSCNKCVQESMHRDILFPFLPCTNGKTDPYLSVFLCYDATNQGRDMRCRLGADARSVLSIFQRSASHPTKPLTKKYTRMSHDIHTRNSTVKLILCVL